MARKTDKEPVTLKPDFKILLIQFRPAGDVLLLISVVRALKKKYPRCRITFMVNEKESSLIRDFSLIDSFILINNINKNNILNYFRYLLYCLSVYAQSFRNKYDVVIDFIGNPKSGLAAFLSRAPIRIGRDLGIRRFAYNNIIPPHRDNMNGVAKRLAHLKPLGIDIEYISPIINFSDKDLIFANCYIKTLNIAPDQRIVIIAPNSPRSSRRWKADYFIETGRALIDRYNMKILIAWGPGEEEYSAIIAGCIGKGAEMIPAATLTELAAIISMAGLVITNDSGVKHMANAAGVGTVTVYGPTSPYTWNHPDWELNPVIRAEVPCIQCEKNICSMENHLCMENVAPQIVLSAVERLIRNS